MASRIKPVSERIARFTDSSAGPDACWPWTGPTGNSGTATLQVGGKSCSVRRLVWEMVHGAPKPTDMIMVTCTNRQCVNPIHLRSESTILEERFWTLVKKAEGDACWEWQGYFFQNGYAGIKVAQKQRHASRVAWELAYGPIEGHVPGHPELEVCVCHRCDNPRCVRPDHLFLGSDQDNHNDMVRKGRHAHGPSLAAAVRRANERRKASSDSGGTATEGEKA